MSYQDEVLSGHREMVAEFGVSITFTEHASGTFDALLDYPSAGDEAKDAGQYNFARAGVTIERAQFVAAGVNKDSRLTITGGRALQVDEIMDDPGVPIVFFSTVEVP